jgi:addiction module HigA family antidote
MHEPPHPGQVLNSRLTALRLSVTAAAKCLGVHRKALSDVLNQRSGLSADMAISLEMAGLGIARSWLEMHLAHNLWKARERAGFASQFEEPTERSVDNHAPLRLRQEFVDLAFDTLTERNEAELYGIITQSLRIVDPSQADGGLRCAAARIIDMAEWPRFYDLICRLWSELSPDLRDRYRIDVNRILTAYRVVWGLGNDGHLHRVLPPTAHNKVEEAFQELSRPRFFTACSFFEDGMKAYDDRPQRGRDACEYIFNALISVSMEIYGVATTLDFRNLLDEMGKKVAEAPKQCFMEVRTLFVLARICDLADRSSQRPFTGTPPEVDFIVTSCVHGIVAFIRDEHYWLGQNIKQAGFRPLAL